MSPRGSKSGGPGDGSPSALPLAPLWQPLPRPLTRCIGRQRELTELRELLEGEARLVTLTGPGGIGKTRLALELGQLLQEEMEISFVSLGSLPASESILGALGEALGLADGEGPGFLLRLRQLRPGPWLCILDSFEHLLSQAPTLTRLLGQIPNLRLVVTSRSHLRVGGEHIFPLQPLAVPARNDGDLSDVASVELFLERARAMRRDFTVLPSQRAALAEICTALEGLPLALELAASRLDVMTLEEIGARLPQKLLLLDAGPQDAAPRHKTMRATIDWSHDLLEPADRLLFRRLSVFSGGARWDHLAAVLDGGGEPSAERLLEGMSRLVRHNLVSRKESSRGTTRFFFMEVIREYAQEELRRAGEEESVRLAACRLWASLARQARQAFGGAEQGAAFETLAEEHENLSASLAYLHSHPSSLCELAQMVSDLGWYWESSGHLAEGRRWAGQVLESLPLSRPERLGPLEVVATMARHQGEYALAESFYKEALHLAVQGGDTLAQATALSHLAETDYRRGEYASARQSYQLSLDIAEGEPESRIAAQIGLGRCNWALQQGEQARVLLQACLEASLEGGFLRQAGWSHNALGELARSLEDWAEARRHFLAGAAIFDRLCDGGPRAILVQNLAFVQLAQRQPGAAAQGLRQAFDHWFRCGSQHGLALSLVGLTLLARQRQRQTEANQLGALADSLLSQLNCPLDPSDRREYAELQQGAGPWESPPMVDEVLVQIVLRLTSDHAPVSRRLETAEGSPLTAREHEVLRLLAQGLSNQAIGEALCISRHTVTVHLRTIYDKLRVHSRSAATRWALDHGLT